RRFQAESSLVFRQRLCGCTGAGDVIKLRELPALIERIVSRESMQQGSHPPGKALNLPYPPQAVLRVLAERFRRAACVIVSQRASQNSYVGRGEIQSLCTC